MHGPAPAGGMGSAAPPPPQVDTTGMGRGHGTAGLGPGTLGSVWVPPTADWTLQGHSTEEGEDETTLGTVCISVYRNK